MDLSVINHRHSLAWQVAGDINKHQLAMEGEHILVAVSGGADSVALLCILYALGKLPKFDFKITAAHVNHNLRGDLSDKDALFSKAISENLGIDFVLENISISKDEGNLEAVARDKRYKALGKMALNCGAGAIATAHHGDDQLETILMRILRGSSINGLSAISWKRNLNSASENDINLIRPLLSCSRQQIRNYLTDINMTWREDHTNEDTSRLRARLRKDVLPILQDIRADAPQHATALAEHIREVNCFLEEQVEQAQNKIVIKTYEKQIILNRNSAKQTSKLIINSLLRNQLSRLGICQDKLTRRALDPIVQAIYDKSGSVRNFDLPENAKAQVTSEQIIFQRNRID